MDYKIILLVVGLCVAMYAGIKYGIPQLAKLKYGKDLKEVLKSLKELAKIFTNDKTDILLDEIYEILLNSIVFAEENSDLGVVDFDKLLDFVILEVEKAGIKVNALEEEILDIACEVICSYLYNKYNK